MPSILHLIPTLSGGGAERQLSMLAAEQSRRGWNVHVGIRRGGVHNELLRVNGVTVHFLGDHKGINPMLLVSVNNLIKQIKTDIVHTWLLQMDIVGGIATLWNAVPWVLSERTSGLAYRCVKLQALTRRYLARFADAVVVANSSHGAAYWREMSPSGFRVFQIANAIDVTAIRKAISTTEEEAKSNDGKKDILVVGRLSSEKALDIVIQSISLIPKTYNFRVLFIGEGPLRDEIEVIIRKSGLNDRITLLPYLSSWWEKLKGTSALISMSRYEGQPNVVLEAMAARCPLIVSEIPAYREFLHEDSAMLVPLDNPVILADAIISLLLDPVSANQRAERAAAYVDGLTIQLAADAYESVYKKVVSGKQR